LIQQVERRRSTAGAPVRRGLLGSWHHEPSYGRAALATATGHSEPRCSRVMALVLAAAPRPSRATIRHAIMPWLARPAIESNLLTKNAKLAFLQKNPTCR
jgi:hypothetical protein